jgi:hypothetical protein
MLLSVVSVLVVAQRSSEVPEKLMNNPVLYKHQTPILVYLGTYWSIISGALTVIL